MANPVPSPESHRPGLNGDRLARLAALGASLGRDRARQEAPPAPANKGGRKAEDDEEVVDLAPIEREPEDLPVPPEEDELAELRAENSQLRDRIDDLKRQLEEGKQLEDA